MNLIKKSTWIVMMSLALPLCGEEESLVSHYLCQMADICLGQPKNANNSMGTCVTRTCFSFFCMLSSFFVLNGLRKAYDAHKAQHLFGATANRNIVKVPGLMIVGALGGVALGAIGARAFIASLDC
jgi:hypothetical protein